MTINYFIVARLKCLPIAAVHMYADSANIRKVTGSDRNIFCIYKYKTTSSNVGKCAGGDLHVAAALRVKSVSTRVTKRQTQKFDMRGPIHRYHGILQNRHL